MVDVKQSSVNMVPSKVEISLRKADQVAWGKLEDPNYKPEPEPIEESVAETPELHQPDWDIADDDISDSDEEWAYDTPQNKKPEDKDKDKQKKEEQILKTKQEVEEEMKKAMEEMRRAEEEKKKLEEQRKNEEAEGYEDMPDLEWRKTKKRLIKIDFRNGKNQVWDSDLYCSSLNILRHNWVQLHYK